ncbi:hypothetical protein F4821DRAFT_273628 [Hypoxylon rubiginosum]|uniref:Uncharacterized protein n=1 Tax=Hypoxylon rubiginosum TaxID=110542 RepID=A0ACC0CK28_9PEZI|nr:hypothetical protein F4821DRAFT_273628 [Hypoxylon rubiginosum]
MDINSIPALDPPDDIESDFVNPPTLMSAVIGTSVTVLTLSFLFVSARVFIKIRIVRDHHIEDWLCYFALVGLAVYVAILIYIENYGFARHQWDVTVAQFMHIMYYLSVLYCIYSPVTMAAKLSVLFQIKRIFTTGARDLVYWVIITSIVANSIFYTGLFFSYVFQCWPRAHIWDMNVPGYCISATSANLASGILNLISDVEALLLPAWAIWHLKMPIKQKLAAFAVFGVGSIAVGIGCVGIYLRVKVLENPDFTWICTQAALLVISEICIVVIVGCLPMLPRLYHFVRRRSHSEARSTDKGSLKNNSHEPSSLAQSNQSSGTRNSRKRQNTLSGSLAKYMSPGVTAGITTLATRTSEEEQFELRDFAARVGHASGSNGSNGSVNRAEGIWKTTVVEQTSSTS